MCRSVFRKPQARVHLDCERTGARKSGANPRVPAAFMIGLLKYQSRFMRGIMQPLQGIRVLDLSCRWLARR